MSLRAPEDYGRVLLVMGGDGSEREVSLDGGSQVLAALQRQDVDVEPIDGLAELIAAVGQQRGDRVFNLLHGRGGEDGVLQGAMRALGVPFTGAGVLGSALSMHKAQAKRIWLQCGLLTPQFALVVSEEAAARAAEELGFPLVCKPPSEGSSVGISMVADADELSTAFELAQRHETEVMLESFIEGAEYTVGVLAGKALPVVRIQPARAFYDYTAKYEDDATGYFCPSGLSSNEEAMLQATALAAFRALECSGWGRIDFIRGSDRRFYLLEANTTPGMTSHSLVPKAAAAAGISFDDLCLAILETSFDEVKR
ncbi:MAG: D-alanine--D-alanine ligase [Xanthomonadales bacterium]|nr:D-alanine--D-alanine ligase [Xanthomonadales bacterium]